ncbi:hypothetical protein AURDEDRAFT_139559 [Auricularia subglabra TFB-10046 SS5]|nr:hypothetical protein AURDEDRAFT_139559 [Auricularia subglabra TFB-10046 SS5]
MALVAVVSLTVVLLLVFLPRAHRPAEPRECERVIVRKAVEHDAGFGSEYNVYLRAKAMSAEMGWTVVSDTSVWIYGRLDDLFVPPTYDCILPADVYSVNQRTWHEFGVKGWQNSSRLYLTRGHRQTLAMDAIVRGRSIDSAAMDEFIRKTKLWALDEAHLTLPYGESILRGTEKAFMEQVRVLQKEWVPNERMQAQIDRLRVRAELNDTESRIRRPVVVLQIRLGDKRLEWSDVSRSGSHMQQADLSVYFKAARIALARLYSKDLTPRPFPPRLSTDPKPLLVVMTAETGIVERLVTLDAKNEFDIILTPSEELSPDEKAEFDRLYGESLSPSAVPRSLSPRWTQMEFLRASLALRRALTRQLVAELTVYSWYADAFVVSGNSNLGRLALVLSGEEGAMGAPGYRAVGGRVRSIDVPFYPSMAFLQLFNEGQFH